MILGTGGWKIVLAAAGLIAALAAFGIALRNGEAGPGPVVQRYAVAFTSYDIVEANAVLEQGSRWHTPMDMPHRMARCTNPEVVAVNVDETVGTVTILCEDSNYESTYGVIKEPGGWKVRKGVYR